MRATPEAELDAGVLVTLAQDPVRHPGLHQRARGVGLQDPGAVGGLDLLARPGRRDRLDPGPPSRCASSSPAGPAPTIATGTSVTVSTSPWSSAVGLGMSSSLLGWGVPRWHLPGAPSPLRFHQAEDSVGSSGVAADAQGSSSPDPADERARQRPAVRSGPCRRCCPGEPQSSPVSVAGEGSVLGSRPGSPRWARRWRCITTLLMTWMSTGPPMTSVTCSASSGRASTESTARGRAGRPRRRSDGRGTDSSTARRGGSPGRPGLQTTRTAATL